MQQKPQLKTGNRGHGLNRDRLSIVILEPTRDLLGLIQRQVICLVLVPVEDHHDAIKGAGKDASVAITLVEHRQRMLQHLLRLRPVCTVQYLHMRRREAVVLLDVAQVVGLGLLALADDEYPFIGLALALSAFEAASHLPVFGLVVPPHGITASGSGC
ncbi:MAG: hypothetical protein LW854_21665 [Rubrivivax sp.]|nr:hypothetical protein [Rubrivivax sp.]